MSESHAVYLFLKNISDTDYSLTVTFLQNTNSELATCVQMLRKAERNVQRKRGEKRKLEQTVRRWRESGTGEERGTRRGKSNSREHVSKDNRSPGFNITKKGFLVLENRGDWHALTEKMKDFITEFNNKIKAGTSVDGMNVPDGYILGKKTCRLTEHGNEEEDAQEEKETSSSKKKKQILLDLGRILPQES